MKRTVTEWQLQIVKAANAKFPNNTTWSLSDRLESVKRQLDDVIASIQVENGTLESDNHAHLDPDHRIAALIADILILVEMRGSDVESELEKVLFWFEGEDEKV